MPTDPHPHPHPDATPATTLATTLASTLAPTLLDVAHLPIDQLPHRVRIVPLRRPFDATISPPGSKSLTNRALLLAALARGTSTLTGALVDADDAQVMLRALRQLGATIDTEPASEVASAHRAHVPAQIPTAPTAPTANATLRVTGVAGRWTIAPAHRIELMLNNAGTATRFLAAAALLQPADAGGIVIDGNARMRQRPIAELTAALTQLGAPVTHLAAPGCPPILVQPLGPQPRAPELSLGRTSSSQFISALLLVAPFLPHGLTIQLTEPPTSAAYISMTLALFTRLGVPIVTSTHPHTTLHIAPHALNGFELAIEPDASGATYFLAARALITGSRLTIPGLDPMTSLQGDSQFTAVLERLAAPGHADIDMAQMPDAAMTAAVVACFRDSPATLRGLRTLRVKETDRIAALVTELAKLSVAVEPFAYIGTDGHPDEGVTITPPLTPDGVRGIDCSTSAQPVAFDTYDDHRMAMSLALVGLRRPNVTINDPACVRKTYPTFWRDLASL